MQTRLKKAVLVGLATLLMVPSIFFALPQTVQAAQTLPQDQLERWLYYRGMRACFESPDFDRVVPANDNADRSASDLNSGKVGLGDRKEGFGYLGPNLDNNDDNDGTVSCGTDQMWVNGAKAFGFPSVVHLICAMNNAMSSPDINDNDRIKPSHPTECIKSDKFSFDGGGGDVFQRALTKALEDGQQYGGDNDRPKFDLNDNGSSNYDAKVLYYLMGKRSLEVFCGNNESIETASANNKSYDGNDDIVSVDIVVNGTLRKSQSYPLANSDRNESSKVDDVYWKVGGNDNEADDITCATMAEFTRTNSDAYLAWAKANPSESEEVNDNNEQSGGNGATCESEGGALAWILCAMLKLMDTTISFLDQKVNELLFIDSDVYNAASVKNATGSIQNIALLILVPIMIFMVIGTALNFGPFDPYTVKKALPRMFIAAIFIVLSLPITQFGVELSNNVGQGLGNLIVSAVPADQRVNSLQDILSPGEAGGFTALTLLGVTGAAATGALTIGIAASIALITLIALLLGFVILVMRQVLLLMLIVVAPLAILAWIFPGNDKLWGIWKTSFIAMLMMYPIIAILIASGKFVAGIAAF